MDLPNRHPRRGDSSHEKNHNQDEEYQLAVGILSSGGDTTSPRDRVSVKRFRWTTNMRFLFLNRAAISILLHFLRCRNFVSFLEQREWVSSDDA